MRTESSAIAGQTLDGVAAAWHEYEGTRDLEPVHVWLCLKDLGVVQLHTLGTLVIRASPVYESYDMSDHGRVVVEET